MNAVCGYPIEHPAPGRATVTIKTVNGTLVVWIAKVDGWEDRLLKSVNDIVCNPHVELI